MGQEEVKVSKEIAEQNNESSSTEFLLESKTLSFGGVATEGGIRT